ncbi:MAG: heme lyase CcmF/NrfE family subunit [Desulfatiglandales bacterium]
MPAIGEYSLVIGLIFTCYSLFVLLWGARAKRLDLIRSGENGLFVVFGLITLSSLALMHAILVDNFQLSYVASYSSRELPLGYKISSFYAGNKGSLLFWTWFLSLFGAIVLVQNWRKNRVLMPYVSSVMLVNILFFLLLMVFIDSPFERLASPPENGKGLNPLLQNPGMYFHPPTLYLGYIGIAVPFAFAVAALIAGRLGNEWIKSIRRWTLVSWMFLAVGNLLGAWWAYMELGWGGYWMWDPVENASFMPWLVATAFLHSIMIQERRGMLKVWNMALIIITYGLTIFGTFLTRSGVVSSVHAFGQSILGPFFIGFLSLMMFFSFALVIFRLDSLKSRNELDSLLSRESSFLFNNLLLLGAAFATLWGTIFPLISEAVRGVKLTVAAPFFNQVNVPIFLGLLLLTGLCPMISWRKASFENFRRNFTFPLVGLLAVGIVLFVFFNIRNIYVIISLSLCMFVFITILFEFLRGTRARHEISGDGMVKSLFNLIWMNKRRYGGYIVHIGVLLTFIGVTGKAFDEEKTANLEQGESLRLKNYTLSYKGLTTYPTKNRFVVSAALTVFINQKKVGTIRPEKNFHKGQEEPTTEVAVRSNFIEDLYVILADYAEDGSATIKVMIKPLIIYLWIGGIVVVLGSILSLLPDARKRKR